MSGGNGGEDATHSEKGTQTNGATQAARCALRRDAERAAMRNVVDAGRAGETDALPAGEHFRAIAASAEAGVRRVRCGEAAAGSGCDPCAAKTLEQSGNTSSGGRFAES